MITARVIKYHTPACELAALQTGMPAKPGPLGAVATALLALGMVRQGGVAVAGGAARASGSGAASSSGVELLPPLPNLPAWRPRVQPEAAPPPPPRTRPPPPEPGAKRRSTSHP